MVPENNSPAPATGKILLVDDEPDIALLVQMILESSGFEVDISGDPIEALDKARAELFDLFILDVQMPRMNGFDLCRDHLKKELTTRDTPVLFLSAVYTHPDYIIQGLEMGALDFLAKPFDNQVLLEKVRNLIQMKQIADKLKSANVRLQQELEMVAILQKKFMDKQLSFLPTFTEEIYYSASAGAMGDFYDAHLLDGRQIFLLADISGHGAAAAVIMAVARAVMLLKIEERESGVTAIACLHDTFRKLLPANYYLTLFYGIFDPDNGELEYISAGHCPVLHFSAKEGMLKPLVATSPPVGLGPGNFISVKMAFLPGDTLFLFTDGLTDARGTLEPREKFGLQRLREAIVAAKGAIGLNLPGIRERVVASLEAFAGPPPWADDVTLFFLHRLGENGGKIE